MIKFIKNLPSQSITIGLLAAFLVLRTKTALARGDVVVGVVVGVVETKMKISTEQYSITIW